MPLEQIADAQVWVKRQGQGDPVIMAHCSLARHEVLLPLVKTLPDMAFTLFDLPGHGRSAAWDSSSPYQEQAVAQMAELISEPAHVFGHSLGATCALRLALEAPEKVRSLTLAEPVFFAAAKGTPAHAVRLEENAEFSAAFEAGDHLEAARLFMNKWGGTPWDTLPAAIQRQMAKSIPMVFATGCELEDDPSNQLAPGRLEALTMPVLLLEGTESHPVVADIQATLARRIPKAQRKIIQGAGHMLPMTHIQETATAMLQLWN